MFTNHFSSQDSPVARVKTCKMKASYSIKIKNMVHYALLFIQYKR